MSIAVDIKVDDERARRMLKGMRGRAADLTVPFRAGGVHMLRSIQENFERGGRPSWKPWAPSTKEKYEREGTIGGRSILRHLGMRGGLLGTIVSKAFKDRLVLGSAKIYARIQQKGGKAGRGRSVTIPARPYLDPQRRDEGVIGEMISEHLMGGV